jgi:hypothetical protein
MVGTMGWVLGTSGAEARSSSWLDKIQRGAKARGYMRLGSAPAWTGEAPFPTQALPHTTSSWLWSGFGYFWEDFLFFFFLGLAAEVVFG